uniref:Uncharacterized protein n=1 Tax=viral metagenome TaxID=1070528 RepID=A0A6M3M698_9ZZZZ
MPRQRRLWPEFFTDVELLALPPEARLLWQAIWCWGDDWGVIRDNARQIRIWGMPSYTDEQVRDWIDQLVDARFLLRGTGPDGQPYLVTRTWDKHQRVDRPNAKCRLERIENLAFDEPSQINRRSIDDQSQIDRTTHVGRARGTRYAELRQGKVSEDKGREEKQDGNFPKPAASGPPDFSASPDPIKSMTYFARLRKDPFVVPVAKATELSIRFAERYPDMDVLRSLENCADWCSDNPEKRWRSERGKFRRITDWLKRDAERGGPRDDMRASSRSNGKTAETIAIGKAWESVAAFVIGRINGRNLFEPGVMDSCPHPDRARALVDSLGGEDSMFGNLDRDRWQQQIRDEASIAREREIVALNGEEQARS